MYRFCPERFKPNEGNSSHIRNMFVRSSWLIVFLTIKKTEVPKVFFILDAAIYRWKHGVGNMLSILNNSQFVVFYKFYD